MPFVFLFESKFAPYEGYYIVADDLTEVMRDCSMMHFLTYRCRIPLKDVVDTIDAIPDGKGGYYAKMQEASLDLFVDPCGLCRRAICGKSLNVDQPMKARWGGKKLHRYPGQAGEGD